jgi:hypothetical protein
MKFGSGGKIGHTNFIPWNHKPQEIILNSSKVDRNKKGFIKQNEE